jgi:alkanesulfonate monooxygenase SsuD/methylene tetrahydromethanopterin reductase-like flavin-dependent oxidoreductase (luciferase family)
MMPRTTLRFTFARPDPNPVDQSGMFKAALEMTRWADAHGVTYVTVDEHHITGFGWSPNPILEAACFLAATEEIRARVSCALGPLWNPIRLAEDIAVIDQLSGGRLIVTLALGYRPVEYAALGADFARRGELMDHAVDTILKAWTGEPFDYRGTTIAVTPLPLTKPHPPLAVGGAARATARRAVRFGLPLDIPAHAPEIKSYYEQLCAEAGCEPCVRMASVDQLPSAFIHEDPERAWAEIGHYLAWEAIEYGSWTTGGRRSVMHMDGVQTIDDVRRSGRYVIITPDDLINRLAAQGSRAAVSLHLLCGGLPVDEAWKSLHLLTDYVLPQLRSLEGQVEGHSAAPTPSGPRAAMGWPPP